MVADKEIATLNIIYVWINVYLDALFNVFICHYTHFMRIRPGYSQETIRKKKKVILFEPILIMFK